MLKQFPPPRDFSSLSVRDLLDARDAYHLHLSHLSNVVATAIGRYRIHKDDWFATHPPHVPRPAKEQPVTTEKTLYNTVVRAWSWPCVLVFVSEWLDKKQFAKQPDQMVPRALFLPDGRVVPTCTIKVEESESGGPAADAPSFPRSVIGGGFSLVTTEQGRDHIGSVGCLVSDGHTIYALTNRHVAGDEGEIISSIMRGRAERIGVASGKTLGKKAFSAVYPEWSGTNAFCNLDIGLIKIDDLGRWTTDIAGIGPIGLPMDLTTDNITLDLLEQDVRAFGGASGPLTGKVSALFYRYKSIGGADYIADFLVATDDGTPTRKGDSGTVWCMDYPSPTKDDPDHKVPRPFAVQWGGHEIVEDDGTEMRAHAFALATSLSIVCRELDIDVVRDWNGGMEYWGDVGHYTIGAKACQLLSGSPDLSKLMLANLDRISYRDELIKPATFKGLSTQDFVPLADVPDKVWKMHGPGARGGYENPNHFADMDKPQPDGKTLLELTADKKGNTDPAKVTVDVFSAYYDQVKDSSRGLLPFRVQEFFEFMVKAAAAGNAVDFVCAAGAMAHYVGDACQPLHISYKFNGDPDHIVDGEKRGEGVHEAYESHMLSSNAPALLARLNEELGITATHPGTHGRKDFAQDGHDAAVKVVDLMRATFGVIKPDEIIDLYVRRPDAMWDTFGDKTVTLLADGARCLAMLWDSAWLAGKSKIKALGPVDQAKVKAHYLDPTWAQSVNLANITALLAGKPVPLHSAKTTKAKKGRKASKKGGRAKKAKRKSASTRRTPAKKKARKSIRRSAAASRRSSSTRARKRASKARRKTTRTKRRA